ncbi:30S ribosomal protein S16 [Striga asiatica]|uniref:30S ribosomal protein S16 n=1 Tax=Striga asiatica TaxID=4170 RepID=A0A5A7QKX2_STRAF|nr:30S ribosomal protein S16 [Striga asiatica]
MFYDLILGTLTAREDPTYYPKERLIRGEAKRTPVTRTVTADSREPSSIAALTDSLPPKAPSLTELRPPRALIRSLLPIGIFPFEIGTVKEDRSRNPHGLIKKQE